MTEILNPSDGQVEHKLARVEDYEPLFAPEVVDRLVSKARRLSGFHVTNINSTYSGGRVAELLSSNTWICLRRSKPSSATKARRWPLQ